MTTNNVINLNADKFEIFNYNNLGQVRVQVDKNGNPWFCLNDVCSVLGLNTNDSNKVLKRIEIPYQTTILVGINTAVRADGTPVIQNIPMNFISEAGLYQAIGGSRKPEAKVFMNWVFGEVLPMIRRTGMYITDDVLFEFMDNPDVFDTIIGKYLEARKELKEAKPKLETYERIMNSDAAFPMSTASKIINFQAPQRKNKSIGRNQMFQILRELEILQCERRYWNIPFQDFIDDGYFKVITKDSNGERVNATVMVTPRGIEFIMRLLESNGYELRRYEPIPEKYNNLLAEIG